MNRWSFFFVATGTLLMLVFVGCDNGLGSDGSGGGEAGRLLIRATVTQGELGVEVEVGVFDNATVVGDDGFGGDAVTDARVQINGVVIRSLNGNGWYDDPSSTITVVSAEEVRLSVAIGGASYEATRTMPEKPGITAPTTGTTWDETQVNTISWTTPTTTPDSITVRASSFLTNYEQVLNGTATTHDVPAETLEDGLTTGDVFAATVRVRFEHTTSVSGEGLLDDSFLDVHNDNSVFGIGTDGP